MGVTKKKTGALERSGERLGSREDRATEIGGAEGTAKGQ